MKVGKLLRLYRNIEDIGIRDFAANLGIAAATLSRVERGLPMTGKTLAKIIHWLTS
jgi:transcriptional regulator with XRE-family HTH domain